MSGKGIEFWQKKWTELSEKCSKPDNLPNEKHQRIINEMFNIYHSECYFTTYGKEVAACYIKETNLLYRHQFLRSTDLAKKGEVKARLYNTEGNREEKILKTSSDEYKELSSNSYFAPINTMLINIKNRIFQDNIIHEDGDIHQILQVVCQNTNLNLSNLGFNIQPKPSSLERFFSTFCCFFPSSQSQNNPRNEDTPRIKIG